VLESLLDEAFSECFLIGVTACHHYGVALLMLVGPSGCGKTTLISAVTAILDRDTQLVGGISSQPSLGFVCMHGSGTVRVAVRHEEAIVGRR
jgi:energy-coupling factor transporter ATP-binding protein EcfA2